MVSQLNRSNSHSLPTLNKWYLQFIDALALLQKGNLDYVAGRGVVALHRDLGESWHEHQPRFFREPKKMIQYTKAQKISRLFWYSLATEETGKSEPDGQPQESTPIFSLSLAFFRGDADPQFREGFRDPSHYLQHRPIISPETTLFSPSQVRVQHGFY